MELTAVSENIIMENLSVFEMNGFKFSIHPEGVQNPSPSIPLPYPLPLQNPSPLDPLSPPPSEPLPS
jgi:hypothetical protein